MFCPYQGKDVPDELATLEHVVPYSVGGSNAFTIKVSKDANSRAGDEADCLLTNNFFIATERIARGLKGQSGNAPSYKLRGTIEVEKGLSVDARYKVSSASPELWMKPEVQRSMSADGNEQIRIACDLADLDRILADVNRKLSAQGKAPIDKEAFIRTAKIVSNEQPQMKVEDSFGVLTFEQPFIKIALGTAHFALGEFFSRTADADLLRKAMWEPDGNARLQLKLHGAVWPNVPNAEKFLNIMRREDHHIVAIANTGPMSAIIILFGQYLGMFKLSDDVHKYASKIGSGIAYVIDPDTRALSTTSYHEHVTATLRAQLAAKK